MINDEGIYARIPNDFFYNDGKLLQEIGGRDSFILYCLLVSRKSMSHEIYISFKEINNTLKLHRNTTKARVNITNNLRLLKQNNLIDYDVDIDNVGSNDCMVIKWMNKFPTKDDFGWVKFYADDFKIHNKIGDVPYCVMWILRMYIHFEKGVSFISITDITAILKCDRMKVQNSIDLFGAIELFEVIKGEYYFNVEYGRRIKMNNSYKYTGNIDVLLKTNDNYIKAILNKNIK